MATAVTDPKKPETKPHGTTDDQIKEMESEGQAQAPAETSGRNNARVLSSERCRRIVTGKNGPASCPKGETAGENEIDSIEIPAAHIHRGSGGVQQLDILRRVATGGGIVHQLGNPYRLRNKADGKGRFIQCAPGRAIPAPCADGRGRVDRERRNVSLRGRIEVTCIVDPWIGAIHRKVNCARD